MNPFGNAIPDAGGGSFRSVLATLFEALGLQAEEREPAGAPEYLSIDGFDIAFDPTGDERAIRASLHVGPLSDDRHVRREQMRRILKRNLALIRDFQFCAVLEESDDGRMLLLLQFRQGFAGLRIPVLAARIGELVSMGELYQDLIATPASNVRTGTETGSSIPADTIIFRP